MPLRRIAAVLLCLCVIVGVPAGAAAHGRSGGAAPAVAADWEWPVRPFAIERAYVEPAHRYGAGHRGVDLRPLAGDDVRSPADGIVAFAGLVGDRPLVTIDHGDGLVSTLEPVASDLAPGTWVRGGDVVGVVSAGGHAEPGSLHFGVRLDGEYVNPLILLGGVPRAVLLPCCE